MPDHRRGKNLSNWNRMAPTPRGGSTIRIIGGRFRSRSIRWSGDLRTRPMKDDLREALFNLVGGWVPGRHVIDLFAGTGAIGLEAISRGAASATLIERHFPTARIIRENVESLDPDLPVEIVKSDTFFWVRQFVGPGTARPAIPWLVFCSPPWNLFDRRADDLIAIVTALRDAAPPDSLIVVESEDTFDPRRLPDPDFWRTRRYPPALLSILRPGRSAGPGDSGEPDSQGSFSGPDASI